MSLDNEKGANITYVEDRECLTEDQTRYVYKKVEKGKYVNAKTMKEEIKQEKITEINPSEENENI